ncbi:MAG: hypothetical protein Fur0044_04520 [Anaerolineae bacterium]
MAGIINMTQTDGQFQWSVRVSANQQNRAVVFVRKHRYEVGLPLHFDEEYEQIAALEYVLGAIGADIVNGLQALARKRRLSLDYVEAVVQGELNNPLTYLDVAGEQGHPGLEWVAIKVYVSSLEPEEQIHQLWKDVLARSPLVRTFQKAVQLELNLQITL